MLKNLSKQIIWNDIRILNGNVEVGFINAQIIANIYSKIYPTWTGILHPSINCSVELSKS